MRAFATAAFLAVFDSAGSDTGIGIGVSNRIIGPRVGKVLALEFSIHTSALVSAVGASLESPAAFAGIRAVAIGTTSSRFSLQLA
jgi:hypothetical protein